MVLCAMLWLCMYVVGVHVEFLLCMCYLMFINVVFVFGLLHRGFVVDISVMRVVFCCVFVCFCGCFCCVFNFVVLYCNIDVEELTGIF